MKRVEGGYPGAIQAMRKPSGGVIDYLAHRPEHLRYQWTLPNSYHLLHVNASDPESQSDLRIMEVLYGPNNILSASPSWVASVSPPLNNILSASVSPDTLSVLDEMCSRNNILSASTSRGDTPPESTPFNEITTYLQNPLFGSSILTYSLWMSIRNRWLVLRHLVCSSRLEIGSILNPYSAPLHMDLRPVYTSPSQIHSGSLGVREVFPNRHIPTPRESQTIAEKSLSDKTLLKCRPPPHRIQQADLRSVQDRLEMLNTQKSASSRMPPAQPSSAQIQLDSSGGCNPTPILLMPQTYSRQILLKTI